MNKDIFLIDAMSLLYRAYYVFIRSPRITSKGENVSALFGFVSSLLSLMEHYNPERIIVVFDSETPTFRHKKFAEYKAEREPTPKPILKAIPKLKEILKAWGIPMIQVDGYEADDVIGTLAVKLAEKGYNVYIFSPDKDYIQLLNSPKITLLKPKQKENVPETVNSENAKSFIGFEPEFMTDFLALQGDKVDGIPGVKGIGEKTAKKLIEQFGHVEDIIENVNKISSKKIRNAIIKEKSNIPFYKMLATIDTNVPIDLDVEELKNKEPDKDKLAEIFNELEFNMFIQKLGLRKYIKEEQHSQKTIDPVDFTIEELSEDNIKEFYKNDKIFIDLLFDPAENPINAKPIYIILYTGKNKAKIFPIKDEEIILLKDLLENENITFVSYFLKPQMIVLRKYGIALKNYFDIRIADFVLDATQTHTLEKISLRYLNFTYENIDKVPTATNLFDYDKILSRYLAKKITLIFHSYEKISKKLSEEKTLDNLYKVIENPLIPVLAKIELNGIKLNTDELLELEKFLEQQLEMLQKDIYALAGMEFNINSPKQLAEVLYEKLKLTPPSQTKTGQPSTNERALSKLAKHHPLPAYILKYRTLAKLKNTYVSALPKLINPKTGKIHTTFKQTGTVTGRLSSQNPNLQNIPIRDEIGRNIRKSFVPSREDFVLISADYSQIELRILAHFSEDENMINAFKHNKDIHRATAALLFNVPEEAVTPEMRSKAKMVNYGLIYGMGAFGLAERLNIPRKEAQYIIDTYFKKYPTIKNFIDKLIQLAKERGYAETLFGRRHYLPTIKSPNRNVRQYAERNAINTPIQGTAADIIKLAMIEIDKQNVPDLYMLLQVHDELVFECPENLADEYAGKVKKAMETVVELKVPLIADVGIGKSWFEAH